MLHGYGGSSVFYYKMLKELSELYQIYCIDLLGMGLSSRPEFKCESTEETIYFFIESLEQWRIAVGLDKFFLCGHSFGGYMASHYALKYTAVVEGLILFSPLGFTKDSLDCRYLESEIYISNLPFWQRRFHNMRMDFFKKKLTPSELVDKYGWLFGFWVRKNLTTRLRLDTENGKILWEFLCTVYSLPMSSEKALHYIINPNIVAFIPLEDVIVDLDIPVTVFYGDKDWMCSKGARRMLKSEKKNFNVIHIDDCGHQMTMENPNELIKHVIDKIETLVELSIKSELTIEAGC
jgi:abhydrolase domain-containing protein 5